MQGMLRCGILLLLAALPLLHGCAPLVIGGAAATGFAVSEDRRTVGTITDDQVIETKASSRIGDGLKGSIEQQGKEHPGRTLLIAVGLGYLLGKALRT